MGFSMLFVKKEEKKMKRKALSIMLACTMAATLAVGCGGNGGAAPADSAAPAADTAAPVADTASDTASADSGSEAAAPAEITDYGAGTITIWVADNVVDFTAENAEAFVMEKDPDYTVVVEPVGEGSAAGNMITDVEGGADLYGFAQDQTARLVSAGALQQLTGTGFDTWVTDNNDSGAAGAAKVGDTIYAFPMTSDNGYFLYYDSSVVTDPSTLEGIISQCEAAGKNFYYDLSGWYNTAFFFGTGCKLEYTTDDSGAFTGSNIDYASDKGVVALQEMIEMAGSSSFQNGSSVDAGTNIGAIVDGTWDAESAKAVFGDNYACAKLPTFTGTDGQTYQMSGFGGFKLMGVKPQTDAGKLRLCLELAQFLTSAPAQVDRYRAAGWGPSNLEAQQNDEVLSDIALAALAQQLAFTIPQGQYPDGYWSLAEAMRDDIIAGNIGSDADSCMAYLENFQSECEALAQ